MIRHGIYRIRNLKNQKCYVGSASGKGGLHRRWIIHQHLLRQRRHHSIHLQRSWDKHGADTFVFEILLYCDPEDCLIFEQIALDCYQPEYNICRVAGSPLGRPVSQKTRNKLSFAQRGPKHHLYGKTRTKATRRKIAKAVSGSRNGMAKLSEAQVRSIRQALQDGIKGKTLANQFGVSTSTISEIKNGKRW